MLNLTAKPATPVMIAAGVHTLPTNQQLKLTELYAFPEGFGHIPRITHHDLDCAAFAIAELADEYNKLLFHKDYSVIISEEHPHLIGALANALSQSGYEVFLSMKDHVCFTKVY